MIADKYFHNLTERQREQLQMLDGLYREWNEKINVVSRKDIDNLEVHHILHSLAIAKFIRFTEGSEVMDLGTGGGFPGIPLAIVFPEVKFHLIDRIGKKINVAKAVAESVGLDNVTFQHGDSGECHKKFDFVVSRAVMPQADLVKAIRKNISDVQRNAIPNGLITLKGGELGDELSSLRNCSEIVDLDNYFEDPFFSTKKLVYTKI